MSDERSIGSECLDACCSLLARYDSGTFQVDRRAESIHIEVDPERGYSIAVFDEGEEAMVAAERWHTHYDDPEQLSLCVGWMLTPFMRVVHEHRGGVIAASWIERYEPEGWMPMDPVFFLHPGQSSEWGALAGGWLRTYRQNFAVPFLADYRKIHPGIELDVEGRPPDSRFAAWEVLADESEGIRLAAPDHS